MLTREKIIVLTRDLVQERGANDFSYQDLADQLKIKKASIHYHFPHKNDLLLAVTKHYSNELKEFLSNLDQNYSFKTRKKLTKYLDMYLELSKSGDKLCLCGILASEIQGFPANLVREINIFFQIHETWLRKLFHEAQENGEFKFTGSASGLAAIFFSTIQGALIISRTKKDPKYLKSVIKELLNWV